jgi:hypothetical protein
MKFRTIETFDSDDQYHCVDGPAALRSNGSRSWWIHDKLHREDGPAMIWFDNCREWYINHTYLGSGIEPPEAYLDKLKEMGIKFVRGSDN